MNTVYRDLILARVKATVDAAEAVTGIGHQGLKGQLREIVIRDLLRPLLPADIGLGTGEIISFDDRHSRQQDIILFDRSIVPPLLLEGATGIFPVESVLATIEIKSKLTAAELSASYESVKQMRSLPVLSGEYDEQDVPAQREHLPTISTVLAFDSDLTEAGKGETERLDEIRGSTSNESLILCLCVVSRGCWIWYQGKWLSLPTTYPLQEVVSFIAVMMNSYRRIAISRKAPRMGHYLM